MIRRLLDADRTMRRALAVVLLALGLASGVFPYGLFRLTASAEEVELRVRLAEEPWPILMDPGQVEQIVINLAVNGRGAMPAGGPLTIETHNLTRAVAPGPGRADMPVGDVAALIVRDEGSGMSQGIVMRLFEPFFTTKPPGRGTGLGLATVHGVVKQHHGHIEVDTAVGFGSTFGVLFPRTEDVILHHGIRTGDMAFLAKPYTFDQLARKVRDALDRRA